MIDLLVQIFRLDTIGLGGPLDHFLHVVVGDLGGLFQVADDGAIAADDRVAHTMNIAEDTRKAHLEGIAGHETLVLHSVGVGRFHEIVGEFAQESRQHAELVAMLSRLHLDTCSQRCNLQVWWKTADHSSDLLDQVRENAMQRPCKVPMCDVEVAVDISLHAVVPIRVEHVLRRQFAALPGDLAEDATRTGCHCTRMIIHKLLIHGAFIGFQLCFLRHRLVILPLGGFDDLLPEVFVVQALL
mmetsp:Transcript_23535/g.48811  ORF Transcript_23535/g.48811 Transcript_23535/m.48811 type:complete len:242 (-) Transcript_23535:4663-5388(-)